jgi:hypothetical protein
MPITYYFLNVKTFLFLRLTKLLDKGLIFAILIASYRVGFQY